MTNSEPSEPFTCFRSRVTLWLCNSILKKTTTNHDRRYTCQKDAKKGYQTSPYKISEEDFIS